MIEINKIYPGDVLKVLRSWPDGIVDCVITSPPYYGLRDYGVDGQIGLEKTLTEYLDKMLLITAELKRVLKKTGTMWWNHGDSYNGLKLDNTETNKNPKLVTSAFKKEKQKMPGKSLLLQAHRLTIRMVDEQQWILRNTIIWHKPNVMPSSVKDRFTVDYEPVFFFTKSKKYWFETQYEPYAPASDVRYRQALRSNKEYDTKKPYLKNTPYSNPRKKGQGSVHSREDAAGQNHLVVGGNNVGRNKRCVWKIPTKPYTEAHFATFPPILIETPIKAGCPPQGVVLDPFMGSGTTALVARNLQRNYLGIELNAEYIKLAEKKLIQKVLI